MEGGRDIQRKRHDVANKVQSRSYKPRKSYKPNVETEQAEAESVPKHSPKVALTSCHLSSCCPAVLTSQRVLRPCPCLSCLWTWRPRRLGPFWPFSFRLWQSSLSFPSPASPRRTSCHPSSASL